MVAGPAARLQAAFVERFHIQLPPEFVADGLQAADDHGLLMSTEPASLQKLLIGRDREALMDAVPEGHHSVGFWGHGANSYAFYLILRTPQDRVYLRLHTGGAYSDPVRAAADITDYVVPFAQLLRETRRRGGRLYAFESMGLGFYAIFVDGRGRKVEGALCGRPATLQIFGRLLSGEPLTASPEEAHAIDALRASALAAAKAIYAEEMRRRGNQRVGMRAMGAAMPLIRGFEARPTAREFRQALLLQLAALAERHEDLDGEHEHGRACIRRLLATWRDATTSG